MTSASRIDARAKSQLDEQRLARGVAIGLPLVTLSVAAVVGMLMGPATSILVVAAGGLLGVIALLWGSLRVLSGDAELSPELAALESSGRGVDALNSRKKMLLRALRDLQNEHGLGKTEDDDFEQLSANYREELKVVLRNIDASLEPHRGKAEEAARAYLVRAGIADAGYRGDLPADADQDKDDKAKAKVPNKAARVACPKCDASNEPDAKFCKECATKLSPEDALAEVSHES